MRAHAVLVVMLSLTAGAGARPADTSLDLPAVSEAVTLGKTGSGERTRFHEHYRVMVSRAPVDYLDVITPFRRIVLAAQSHAAAGDRAFGQRQALELLSATGGRLDVVIELTFHPLNTYVGVPGYGVSLAPRRGATVPAAEIVRLPRWTPRVGSLPLSEPEPGAIASAPQGQALIGGTIIARFDLRALDPAGAYDVVIGEGGQEIARARIDLGRVR